MFRYARHWRGGAAAGRRQRRAREGGHADSQKILRLETAGTGRGGRLFVGSPMQHRDDRPRQRRDARSQSHFPTDWDLDRVIVALPGSRARRRLLELLVAAGRRARGGAGAAADRHGGAIARTAVRSQKAAGRRPGPAVGLGRAHPAVARGGSRAAGPAAAAGRRSGRLAGAGQNAGPRPSGAGGRPARFFARRAAGGGAGRFSRGRSLASAGRRAAALFANSRLARSCGTSRRPGCLPSSIASAGPIATSCWSARSTWT